MKIFVRTILSLTMIAFVTPSYASIRECDKSHIIVTTDLGGTDPDDIQSMIHILLCSAGI